MREGSSFLEGSLRTVQCGRKVGPGLMPYPEPCRPSTRSLCHHRPVQRHHNEPLWPSQTSAWQWQFFDAPNSSLIPQTAPTHLRRSGWSVFCLHSRLMIISLAFTRLAFGWRLAASLVHAGAVHPSSKQVSRSPCCRFGGRLPSDDGEPRGGGPAWRTA